RRPAAEPAEQAPGGAADHDRGQRRGEGPAREGGLRPDVRGAATAAGDHEPDRGPAVGAPASRQDRARGHGADRRGGRGEPQVHAGQARKEGAGGGGAGGTGAYQELASFAPPPPPPPPPAGGGGGLTPFPLQPAAGAPRGAPRRGAGLHQVVVGARADA